MITDRVKQTLLALWVCMGLLATPLNVNVAFNFNLMGTIKMLCTIHYKVKFAIETGFAVREANWK